MKPLFECELHYFHTVGLAQIYDGFEKLRRIGIVDFTLKPIKGNSYKPLLTVIVNKKHRVIYDTLDGMNWINGSIEDNLDYFKNSIQADFYFKRSYNKQVLDHAPQNCRVYPLGLNYPFKPEGRFPKEFKETIKDLVRNNSIVSKYYNRTSFCSRDFEFYPIPCEENKVLGLTRLWNPGDVSLEHLKIEREIINKNRIDWIEACQKEFGRYFVGGLIKDDFSMQRSKELVMPFSLTKREVFLNAIREHNICIATTGLHDSLGWRFGEYVAASRAIISEPLRSELPGKFENEKNYLIFNNEEELLNKIHFLRTNKDALFEMMNNNFQYYSNYLRPDRLVLNTLLVIHQNS
jgi:hypothetical protein